MYDFLLFVHVLSAFLLASTVVTYSAVALGADLNQRVAWVNDRLWDIGGTGTLVFGVWLAVYVDAFGVFDGWVIAALVLWTAAAVLGYLARGQLARPRGERPTMFHWIGALLVVLLLADMIWKPGA